jgi:hypothetical protein
MLEDERRASMRRAAHQRQQGFFSLDAMAAAYLSVIQEPDHPIRAEP